MNSESSIIQVACAKATGACIVSLEDDNSRNKFRAALEPIINVLGNTLSRGDEADAVSIMDHLVTIAQVQPIFFKGFIDNIVTAMLTIVASLNLEFSTRSTALELMVTLTETAPALARRCPGLVQGVVPLAMSLMLEYDQTEQTWMREKYSEEQEDGDYFVGEEAIERVAAGMGGRTFAPVVFSLVAQYMGDARWLHRRAAVAAMGRLAEGCAQMFVKSYMEPAIDLLAKALSDPSPIVLYEGVTAVGRFAALFPSEMSKLVARFVPRLTCLLAAPPCERVRGQAAAAMINLFNPEHCDSELLGGALLNDLLQALATCLNVASAEVQSPCLVLLGCVAQVKQQDGFAPYYSLFMPGIKAILTRAVGDASLSSNATPHAVRLMCGKAMECAGLLGEAVGDQVFSADALEIMGLLALALNKDQESSDMTFEYILPACARIATALKSRFEPFLPLVMGPLLAGAAQQIQFTMEDVGDEDEDDGELARDEEAGTDSAVISLGGGVKKRVTLNTHAVQQKAQAAKLLYEFGESMQGHLKAYLRPSLTALLGMVTDKHSADIRSSASLALANIFGAFLDAFQKSFITAAELQEVFTVCMSKLLECVQGEINGTSRACAAEALRDVLEDCYSSGDHAATGARSGFRCGPDLATATAVAQQLLAACGSSLGRYQDKQEAFSRNEGVEEEDREAFQEELEEEEEALANLVDAIGHLLKLHGDAFMPFFDSSLAPAFSPFLAADKPAALQVLAVCLLDDAVEFGGAAAAKYVPQSLSLFVGNLRSGHLVLRQCSSYGVAMALLMAPQYCVDALPQVLAALIVFLEDESLSGGDDNQGARENALFALGAVLRTDLYRAGPFWPSVSNRVSSLWLSALPLSADERQSKTSLLQLCELVERGDPVVLGEGLSNAAGLLRIAADVLLEARDTRDGEPQAHGPTLQRLKGIARQLARERGEGLSGLSPQQQQALRDIC